MTSTRERLERRDARPRRRRTLLVVATALVVLLAAGALIALWWLPPVLAETPRERLTTATAITLTPADSGGSGSRGESGTPASGSGGTAAPVPSGAAPGQSASVTASAGWVVVGIGPFLAADRAVLLSPDGVLRVEVTVIADTAADPNTNTNTNTDTDTDSDPTTDTAPDPDDPGASDLSKAEWSDETLASGNTVHYAELTSDGETTLVALVRPADTVSGTGIMLTLRATTPTDRASTYRGTIADLLTAVTFAPTAPLAPATPTAEPRQ